MDSILASIKKLLGIQAEYTQFDADIIMHINSAFSILAQIGAGPSAGFSIKDASAVWSDFLSDMTDLELIKTYIYQRVRLYFDPPSGSPAIDAINRSISELEWRIQVLADTTTV